MVSDGSPTTTRYDAVSNVGEAHRRALPHRGAHLFAAYRERRVPREVDIEEARRRGWHVVVVILRWFHDGEDLHVHSAPRVVAAWEAGRRAGKEYPLAPTLLVEALKRGPKETNVRLRRAQAFAVLCVPPQHLDIDDRAAARPVLQFTGGDERENTPRYDRAEPTPKLLLYTQYGVTHCVRQKIDKQCLYKHCLPGTSS